MTQKKALLWKAMLILIRHLIAEFLDYDLGEYGVFFLLS